MPIITVIFQQAAVSWRLLQRFEPIGDALLAVTIVLNGVAIVA